MLPQFEFDVQLRCEKPDASGRHSNSISVGQQTLYQFYEWRLPDDATDLQGLTQWLRKAAGATAVLDMRREDLLGESDVQDTSVQYPDALAIHKTRFPLQYRFVPGDHQDGITMTVPQASPGPAQRCPGYR